ncbi:DivIVA domain-containing protein [Micromonospora sp. Llam0]|uniref:DivIVA domain-containing protein n=1 Tax=Micromonospora sp. Llam0 TaxID=2485143 RepID=UPI001F4877B0|nr:DivIVA domain-containing protein [Micromonospora sp. Llam0]
MSAAGIGTLDRTRRGLDPAEVRAFLHLVADELAALRAELAMTRDDRGTCS